MGHPTLKTLKRRSCAIAKQLGYLRNDPQVIDRINAAVNENEVTRAMITARNKVTR